MTTLLAATGAFLVAVALVDMLWTTVAVSAGAGPLTGRVSNRLWTVLRSIGTRYEWHRFLRLGGVLVVVAVFLVWIVLLVGGWALIFSSSPGAIVDAQTGAPADGLSRVYFAGYTASTLGLGGFAPGDGIWQVLTVIASFSGLGVVTMAITYLVPVVGAVTDRRTLALRISALGTDPIAILRTAAEDRDWRAFERELERLSADLTELGERHLAYPVLHYFHDVDRPAAAAVMIAVLDETLTILRYGYDDDARPSPVALRSARNAIASFLSTLEAGHIDPVSEPPPPAPLQPLRDLGLRTVSDDEFAAEVAELSDRRRSLRAFLEDDGWDWESVYSGDDPKGDDAEDGVSQSDLDDAA